MTAELRRAENRLQLRLPATSANLGPGFDALGLAISLFLEIDAHEAESISIRATGRDAAITGALTDNLMLQTYGEILHGEGVTAPALALRLHNAIPLGMGCGSSAAALCAGVLLANHFGRLGWTDARILHEAAEREGHPDNVAACLYGGLTASKMLPAGSHDEAGRTVAATLGRGLAWRLVLVLPQASLATAAARALLPPTYSRADAVVNLQSTALLLSAFALDRPDLLATATEDRMHQPYRSEACPLLAALLPLVGQHGILSVMLSGAGPAVLLIVSEAFDERAVRQAAGSRISEVLPVTIAAEGALQVGNPHRVT